ncbi:diacylglycerol kinase (ATP) [Friedmanniella endophytica]|uniref:Diacylglycerol kinase (ATP) n=1 Tax=Microlunatus kandeliicorticis TaxID=1759536 RepID=A0A7W3IU22_9ACTN|nr:YegS/Rv2252/BmrU family lipid kinase [Microlunatus kandeliicorticis]MBA8795246.1 diacylglycerol kinase (ATP) [Microlunatus kandeliicorticis]
MSGRSVALIANPTAGKGRAAEVLPEVQHRLRAGGLEPTLLTSEGSDHAARLLEEAAHGDADVLAVLGGDGMMHLAVNACARARAVTGRAPALGLIPAGTGNDLCRGLGMDPDDAFAATDTVVADRRRLIDLARVGESATPHGSTWVSTIVASGFDAHANARANALPWPRGGLRYPLAVLVELARFTPLHYRLTVDGTPRELDAMLVAVGNTAAYGGGVRMCPDADATDGLLDVTIIHPVSRLTLLRLLPKTYDGSFVTARCVERFRAREVRVDGDDLLGYGDGERIGDPPLLVTSVPRAVEVLVPS